MPLPPSLGLDHFVISVPGLHRAIHRYSRLGFTVVPGGRHREGLTHNALIPMRDSTYLELLAPTGIRARWMASWLARRRADAPAASMARHFLRRIGEAGEGLIDWALIATDLDAELHRLKAAGLAYGPPIPGERIQSDGTRIAWRISLPAEPDLPFLIQDLTDRALRLPSPGAVWPPNRATRVVELRLGLRDPTRAIQSYARLLEAFSYEGSADSARLGLGGFSLWITPSGPLGVKSATLVLGTGRQAACDPHPTTYDLPPYLWLIPA